MIIKVENIKKKYYLGNTVIHALNDVSFSIKKGELAAVSGPSGSGKSTLMHILGCLDTIDKGSYVLENENVSLMTGNEQAAVRNRKIGFVFQSFNLLHKLSALENVELPLLYGAVPNAKELAVKALIRVGLKNRLNHEPNQLSGGERQRVAVARAIVTAPAILLADEPTGNLDSKSGDEILKLFLTLNEEGRTIIIVTHDMHIAGLCKKQIHIHDGKIV